jgi:hypothetical protein
VPIDRLAIAGPDELLWNVLRRSGPGDGRILVVGGRRLVGIVTPTDITNALESLGLRRELTSR